MPNLSPMPGTSSLVRSSHRRICLASFWTQFVTKSEDAKSKNSLSVHPLRMDLVLDFLAIMNSDSHGKQVADYMRSCRLSWEPLCPARPRLPLLSATKPAVAHVSSRMSQLNAGGSQPNWRWYWRSVSAYRACRPTSIAPSGLWCMNGTPRCSQCAR